MTGVARARGRADTLRRMDLEQLEAFALAEDREAVLAQLVPGTDEYYYLHCLHYQHTGELARSYELLERWIERHGRTDRVMAMSHRQALLSWPHDPQGCLDYLREVLGLRFDHVRETEAERRALPVALDARHIARDTLEQRTLQQHRDLSGFTDSALEWLVAEELDPIRRRQLLERLRRPDHAQVVELVLADLAHARTEGFGSLALHGLLLRAQLDELARRRPALWEERAFVDVYLQRLQPGPDEDITRDPAARRAYVERLWQVVSRLAPAFASLQAHVLYHRLALDRREGRHDRERFLEYLRLPRQASYVPDAYLREHRGRVAQLAERFATGLEPVGDDEPLVHAYLAHLLADAGDYEAFAPYVRDDVLRRIFATTKLLAGHPDGERWYAMLDDPGYYQALKDRVDIDFAPTSPTWLGAREPVALEVDIKNVPALVIKVYEIDTLGYYTSQDQELDTDVDLDGLPASQELVVRYDDPPLLRARRRFELPGLERPGVYVIDLIGNGKSSRALIRKGRLGYVERLGAAGHVITVVDEQGRALRDAGVWLGGQEYQARDDGTALIPYSTRPGRRTMLLRHGDLTVRALLEHRAEEYTFSAGFYVDREALVPGSTAKVLVRPRLAVSGAPARLSLLEQPVLVISTVDRHGVRTSKEVADFALHEDQESVYELRVPPALAELRLALRARVHSVSAQRHVEVSAEARYAINAVDGSHACEGFHLSRAAAGYVLYVLGKSGEPRPGVPVSLSLRHRDFARPVTVDLQSDARGRVVLGALEDIEELSAQRADGAGETGAGPARWPLGRDRVAYPQVVHALAGEDIEIPCVDARGGRVSLLERRGQGYVADWARACAMADGYLLIRGLPAGDFELWLSRDQALVEIRVAGAAAAEGDGGAAGRDDTGAGQVDGWIPGATRLLERTPRTGLHITDLRAEGEAVEIHLARVTPRARVHVFGARLVPAFALADALAPAARAAPGMAGRARSWCRYVSGRRLGDEYRYVLERKQDRTFPGVMLERPGLLLNPWAVRRTDTGEEQAREGDSFGAAGAPPAPRAQASRSRAAKPRRGLVDPASVDFLAEPGLALVNVRPEPAPEGAAEGADRAVLRIARADLGHAHLVRVLATDGTSWVYRELALPEREGAYRDLRLADGLDAQGHFVQQQRSSVLRGGETLEIADPDNARWEVYDTLAKVFDLFAALSADDTLKRFRFVLDWPALSEDEKRERYGEHACHELHLFLWRKDPGFFEAVVRPYLRSKKEQTFVDRFLLGEELRAYCETWAHGRLNAMERILLGQRVEGRREAARRHIEDRCDLVPPDPARDERLFRTALQRGALESTPAPGGPGGGGPGAGVGGGGPPRPPRAPGPARAMAPMAEPRLTGTRAAVLKRAAVGGPPGDVSIDVEALAHVPTEALEAMLAGDEGGMDRDVAERAQVRRLYRAADRTEEWAESNYYRVRASAQGPGLIPVNGFWRDFARHHGSGPFLSAHVAEATSCFAEMMCALAVLDLPFAAGAHEIERGAAGLRLRAAGPAIVFREELAPAVGVVADAPVQVRQHYLRHDDRFVHQGSEQRARYATGALLARTVYACEVVLGNVTPAPLDVEVLWQIPAGAVPVGNGAVTRSQRLRLEGYQTRSLEYAFYFPAAGTYAHFPVHVSRGEEVLAAASPRELAVVEAADEPDTTSWAHVSQHGTGEAVLAYLEAHNVERLDLGRIAWRMEERGFYDAVIAHLEARHAYDRTLWSYAFRHRELARVAAFLRHEDWFLRACGPALRSPVVDVEPVAHGWHEHLEYAPLIHARAHALGGKRKILNPALAEQYRRFLDVLACWPAPSDSDRLAAAYYLLLQDRVAEGLAMFDRVDGSAVSARLAHDYMAAVVALYRGDAGAARQVAAAHAEHPVPRWRRRFAAVLRVVDEAAGAAPAGPEPGGKGEAGHGEWLAEQGQLAGTQASFDLSVEKGEVVLSYQSLARIEVRYYLMDIELAFSRAPFVSQGAERFAMVKPHRAETVALPPGAGQHRFDLPSEYARRNIAVEVVAAGMRKAQGHYAHDLLVQIAAPYGQVRVYEQAGQRPLPRSYVKVYARTQDGAVRFYKDGYTDLRGCFDYASLSQGALERVARFAMLVVTEEHGAVIREAAPPQQ